MSQVFPFYYDTKMIQTDLVVAKIHFGCVIFKQFSHNLVLLVASGVWTRVYLLPELVYL